MKDVTVRTSIAAKELNDEGLKAAGKGPDGAQADFVGGRTFPFPEKMAEVTAWEPKYAELAKSKGWSTEADFLADAETGFRIRQGKEIRDKARAKFAKGEAGETSEKTAAPAPSIVL